MSLFQNMKSKLLPIAAVSVLTAGVFAGAEAAANRKGQRQKTRQS